MPAISPDPRRRLRQGLLLVSLSAWAMLLTGGAWLNLPAYCGASARFLAPGWAGLELALVLNPPGGLAAAWLVMLLAMMPPLLDRPLGSLLEPGPARRPLRAAGLFLLGYGAAWMAAGAMLVLLAIGLRAVLPGPGAPPAIALLAAVAWQVSPWKQHCLNRCRDLAADRDALRFGLAHGGWCVGVSWALMALPLTIESGHYAAMALVTLFLAAERQGRRPWPLRLSRAAP
jgi:predicted metal-binding membrane protein